MPIDPANFKFRPLEPLRAMARELQNMTLAEAGLKMPLKSLGGMEANPGDTALTFLTQYLEYDEVAHGIERDMNAAEQREDRAEFNRLERLRKDMNRYFVSGGTAVPADYKPYQDNRTLPQLPPVWQTIAEGHAIAPLEKADVTQKLLRGAAILKNLQGRAEDSLAYYQSKGGMLKEAWSRMEAPPELGAQPKGDDPNIAGAMNEGSANYILMLRNEIAVLKTLSAKVRALCQNVQQGMPRSPD